MMTKNLLLLVRRENCFTEFKFILSENSFVF